MARELHKGDVVKRLELLRSPVFLAALAVLVVNDCALKPLFHNALTGKLSDFAGLAAFTIFLCSLWRERRLVIAVGLSAAFILWKSAYSQGLIAAANHLLPFPIGRTVDYTDLAALPVVWLCCAYAPRLPLLPMRAFQLWFIAAFSIAAFTATSPLRYITEREMARLGPPNYAAQASEREARIQNMLDELAKSHGMHCTVCKPLAMGRVYEKNDERIGLLIALYASYDSKRSVLVYETRWKAGWGGDEADALRAELKQGMRKLFSFIDDHSATDVTTVEEGEVDVMRKDGSPPKDDAENTATYRAALPIVARVAAEAGLEKESEDSFSAGPLLSLSDERALNVTVYPFGPKVVVTCRTLDCKERVEPLAQKIASALAQQFGARRVVRGWSGRMGEE